MKIITDGKRGFTIIEVIIALALIAILVTVSVFATSSLISSSNKKVCYVQALSAVRIYKIYQAMGESYDADNTNGMSFLIQSGFLNEEFVCPEGGEYTWHVGEDGKVSVSCSFHEDFSDEISESK